MSRVVVFLSLIALTFPAAAKKPKAPDAAAPAVSAPKDALLAAADEIVRQVAALRGLKTEATLQRGVLTREAIGQKLKERLAKEYTPDEVRAEARVLKRLGLLPSDADYEKLILDLLMEQVAGFYDPFAARLYIADWLPLEMQRPALAHEIEHALQDQHFDLKRFASPIKDDGDRQLARSALVEGDGTAVMLEFQAQSMGLPADQLPELVAQIGKQMLQGGGLGNTPLFDHAPAFLKETLIFPYLSGLMFVESIRRSQPWKSVDEVWKSPPESTEQVLHPEKYTQKEHPVKITPAPLPSLKKKELRRDVLGELEWKIWLGTKLPEAEAEKAAAGWGGDREVAYADGEGAPTVIDLSTWDTEGDAKEAADAARKVLASLAGKPDGEKGNSFTDAAGEVWSVELRGDKLLVLCGAPAASAAALAGEVWAGWKIAGK
jgi:hypothetical protein